MPTILCNFVPQEDGRFKCSRCSYTTRYANASMVCKIQDEPKLVNKVVNFIAAATKHAMAGNPVVSEETMKKRLDICKSCPLFKPNSNTAGGVCTHESCGCSIQDNLNYLNKIAWADQECPIGKWGKDGV